jgi:hypothetical protein
MGANEQLPSEIDNSRTGLDIPSAEEPPPSLMAIASCDASEPAHSTPTETLASFVDWGSMKLPVTAADLTGTKAHQPSEQPVEPSAESAAPRQAAVVGDGLERKEFADLFHERAAACVEMANISSDTKIARSWLLLAKEWLALAEQLPALKSPQ